MNPGSPLRGNHSEGCGADGDQAKTRRVKMKYAIVENGGKQYRAVEGGTIEVDLLQLDPGKDVKLDRVLLLVDDEAVSVGTPILKNASVKARVVEHFKGQKTLNFQYSPKKRIRTKTGHRQPYTRLAIEKIAAK
jgi:large subunit ribosomal protein L21